MDAEALRLAVEQAGFASVVIAFLAGLLFSINPVAIAAIPVSLAYITRARDKRTAALFGGMFIFGLIATHVLLGLAAGFGGHWVSGLLGRYWGAILGPILVMLGLVWLGWLRVPLPALSFRAKRVTGMWGAFALGIPFSVAICPVCTPALVVLLGVAATLGSPLLGAAILLAFAIGRSIPIAAGAWAIGSMENWKPLTGYQRLFDVAGGAALILAGLYMLNAYYFLVPKLAG